MHAGTAAAYTPAGQIEDADTSVSSAGDVSGTRYYTLGGATVAVRTSEGNLALVLGDEQGSVSVTMPVTLTASGTMASATVADAQAATRTSYTPYGQLRGADNLALDRGWLGQVEDRADPATGTGTGLTYLNARYYDPALARFITPDPLMNPADPATLDPYRYADNNPVVFTDATGLAPLKNMMIEGWSGSGGSSTVKATRATTQAAAVSTRKQLAAIQAQHKREMAAIGTPTQAFWKTTPDTWVAGAQGAVNFFGGALNGLISTVNGLNAINPGARVSEAITGKSSQIPTVGIWGDYDTFKYSSWLGTGVFTAATSIAPGVGIEAGLARVASSGRVLWSGVGRLPAEAFAATSGGALMDATAVGRVLEAVGGVVPYRVMRPLWDFASRTWVRQAEGPVNVFAGPSQYGGFYETTLGRVELPEAARRGLEIVFHAVS